MRNTYFTDIPRNAILSAGRGNTLTKGENKKPIWRIIKCRKKVFLIMSVIFVCAAVMGSCFFNMNFMVGLVLCVIPGIMGFMLKKASK